MSVDIEPQELGFRRPFTVEVSEVLKIKNPNTHPCAFKVKTTAPKQYCVRPNSGRVEPGKEVEVSVILQAMKQEPPMDTKCRDKFLVQSVAITGDKEFAQLASIWDGVEKSAVQEKKIRVVFLPPSGTAQLETPSKPMPNGNDATPDVAPPAYSSPAATSADVKEESPAGTPEAGTSSAAAFGAISKGAELTYEELKQQLAQAGQTIAQLKETQGLRQRKTGSSDEKATSQPAEMAQAVRTGTEGVPVKITAILCLLSFLLAYLLF